jgi:hypothetical protein
MLCNSEGVIRGKRGEIQNWTLPVCVYHNWAKQYYLTFVFLPGDFIMGRSQLSKPYCFSQPTSLVHILYNIFKNIFNQFESFCRLFSVIFRARIIQQTFGSGGILTFPPCLLLNTQKNSNPREILTFPLGWTIHRTSDAREILTFSLRHSQFM